MMTFSPAWWLPGPHAQTLWPNLLRPRPVSLIIEKERIELSDGDFVDLAWVGKNKTGPLLILLHGLEGSFGSRYIQGMMDVAESYGWRSVCVHFRSCSGELNRLPRYYHSGDTQDLASILMLLRAREPSTPFVAVGYSLGGNVLLKWLGESQEQDMLQAAVAVSVPFELHKAAQRVQHGFSRLYQWQFLKSLDKKVREKAIQQANFILPYHKKPRTMREFDGVVTAPLHGFASVDDYYARSSSRQYLQTIRVPTLLIQAKDDPFMTLDLLPMPHELSSFITFCLTEQGGHVGFVSGKNPLQPVYWLEQVIPAYFMHYLT